MTGTRPTFETRIDIPAIYDAQGTDASCQRGFADACDVTAYDAVQQRQEADKAVERQQDVFIQQKGDAGKVGKIETTNAATSNAAREAKAKEAAKKRAEALDRATLLNLLDDRINDLDNQLAEFDRNIQQAEDALSAVDELEDLHRKGELDPNKPAHADLMRKAGISKDDIEQDPDGAFDSARNRWKSRLDDLKKGRDDVQRDRDRAGDMRDRYKKATTPEARDAVAKEIAEELEAGDVDAARLATANLEADDKLAAEVVTTTYAEAGRDERVLDRISDSFGEDDGWGDDEFTSEYESFAETIDVDTETPTTNDEQVSIEVEPQGSNGQFPKLDFGQPS